MKNLIRERIREGLLREKMLLKDYSEYIKLVTEAYQKAPDYDASVLKHWVALNQSNHSLFKRLLSKVNVIFTTNDKSKVGEIDINGRNFKIEFILPQDEYQTQSQMKQSFNETGVLKISIDYSDHPYFSVVDNIVFRTVHDYIAHILGDYDFGAKGEIACYNLHAKMATKEAVPALFTEVVGQASVTVVTGSFPIQKIALLDGFDYYNLGKVDDERYEIKNKMLVKKGEEAQSFKRQDKEPTAIHTNINKDENKNVMRISELYTKEIMLKEFWNELSEKLQVGYDESLFKLLERADDLVFRKFNINPEDKVYFIAGSSRLFIYPILKNAFGLEGGVGDLDIVIPNKELWIKAGLEKEWNSGGIYRPVSDGSIEVFNVWDPSKAGGKFADVSVRSTQQIMNDTTLINGYWFMSLSDIIDYKTKLNRDKEGEIVDLINGFKNSGPDKKQNFLRRIVDTIGVENTRTFIDTLK